MGGDKQKKGGPPPVPPFDPRKRVGEIIDGRYRLLRFVGKGGMGHVYRAEHIRIRKSVAIKLVQSGLARTEAVAKRFEREAYAIGRIDHPNCVSVSDFGELKDGSLFLVMDFVDGESLGSLLARERRLSIHRALTIVSDVLKGLEHAHEKGIVHRDVKPDNILLSRGSEGKSVAKLLDFGIAKITKGPGFEGDSPRLTQAGVAFGTPVYLSPEQAVGKPADARTDVYATSVMLFEMLTGQPPYNSDDNQELLGLHVSGKIPTLKSAAPDLNFPEVFELLVRRGMAKKPDNRYASAKEFLSKIEMLLSKPQGKPKRRTRYNADGDTLNPTLGAQAPALPEPKRWFRGASIAAAFAATAIVLALAVPKKNEPPVQPTASPSIANWAKQTRQEGEPIRSLEALENKDLRKDANAQLQLGHSLAATHRYNDALEAYSKATSLDSSLFQERDLHANLLLMIDTKGVFFPRAADLLLQYSANPSVERIVQEAVLNAAVSNQASNRQYAREFAKRHGFQDEIDNLQVFILDLQQGTSCQARRDTVARLRALRDPRAIPALRKARYRTKKRSKRNINKCLRREADDAIAFLKALQ